MTPALLARGVSAEHAACVVDGLIEASLRGIDTHGVRLFRTYIAGLDGGQQPRAEPALSWSGSPGRPRCSTPATPWVWWPAGWPPPRPSRLAREYGVGAVSGPQLEPFRSRPRCYTLAIARQGAARLGLHQQRRPGRPGRRAKAPLRHQPGLSGGGRRGGELFCADFATSRVSYSRVKAWRAEPGRSRHRTGRSAQGEELLALEPLGGHKGQCLGMMIEILCALLAGMPLDHQIRYLYDPPFDQPRQIAHLFLAIDPRAFGSAEVFRKNLGVLLATVRQEPAADGERVVVPGDLEKKAWRIASSTASRSARRSRRFSRVWRRSGRRSN